jgi:hypothetical protein
MKLFLNCRDNIIPCCESRITNENYVEWRLKGQSYRLWVLRMYKYLNVCTDWNFLAANSNPEVTSRRTEPLCHRATSARIRWYVEVNLALKTLLQCYSNYDLRHTNVSPKPSGMSRNVWLHTNFTLQICI